MSVYSKASIGESYDKPNAEILDMTAGSRMFWWNKENENTIFLDKRDEDYNVGTYQTKSGEVTREVHVHPDIVADWFKDGLPFPENRFSMVVFDPPHLLNVGDDSWLYAKYARLDKNWEAQLAKGFNEAMRVLKPYGTLVFKWNDEQIKLPLVLKAIGQKPLFGDKKSKTHWLVFMKGC